jgi:hypothetical protein
MQANGAVLLDAGAGPDSAAIHTVGGKGHQIFMQATPDGHLMGSLPTYSAWSGSLTGAANLVYWHLFNAAGSGKTIKLRKVFIQPSQAVTAITAQTWRVAKTSSVGTTGNTAITVQKHDSSDAALPSQVTVARSYTSGGTQAFTFFELPINPEETMPGSTIASFWNILPVDGDPITDYVIREGEGVAVQNITGGAYAWSVLGVFTVV